MVHSARSATRRTVVASIPSLATVSHTAWERRRLVASVVSTDKEYPLVTTVTERLGLSIGVVNGEGVGCDRVWAGLFLAGDREKNVSLVKHP